MDRFMEFALRLAEKAQPFPNPRVGAVLVKGGRVLGAGYHKKAGMPHAEIEAIRNAKRRAGTPHAARGATLYVTLEPCSHTAKRTPPCTEAIAREGIARVVYAMKDPNPLVSGAAALRRRGIAATRIRQLAARRRAESINRRYLSAMRKKPFVMIKMAMSADGKTATRKGDSRWIGSGGAREYVHRLRGSFDAVMVGAGTVKTDDPELTTRLARGPDPWRVIVDGRLSIQHNAKVLRNPDGKTIVATCEMAPKAKLARLRNALVCGKEEVDMVLLLRALGAMGMKRILIEGGSHLNARALEAGIVDRLLLFVAPMVIGGVDAKPVVGGTGTVAVAGALRLRLLRMRRLGPDLMLEYEVWRKGAGRRFS